MKKALSITLILLILLFGFITLRLGSALLQERNPIPIITSIVKLELTNSNYQQVSETDNGNWYVSKNTEKSRGNFDFLKEFMKERNWDFKEQMGAGLVFEKDREIVTIGTKLYSKYYLLWYAPKEVFR